MLVGRKMTDIQRHVRTLLAKQKAETDPQGGQMHVYLSDESWKFFTDLTYFNGYTGRGHGQGTSSMLEALFAANQTPSHWTDARPEYMKAYDLARLQAGKLPMWFEDDTRGVGFYSRRSVRTSAFDQIIPVILDLSRYFGIRSAHHAHGRADGNAVLEAIGLKHLVASAPIPRCKFEKNTKRAVWYENKKRVEARLGKKSEIVF